MQEYAERLVPGEVVLNLPCPSVYYWDPLSTTADSKAFLARHGVPNRKTPGVGHWPMIASEAEFYGAVEEDVLKAVVTPRRARSLTRGWSPGVSTLSGAGVERRESP